MGCFSVFYTILFASIFTSKGLPMVPIKTSQKALEVLSLALDVQNVVDSLMGNSNNVQFDQDKLLADLTNKIDAAKTEILSSIILRSKLDRIDDAVIAIHSSLIDVKNILEADTGISELLNLFQSRFEEHDVIKHVRFLKTLLTYKSPGDDVNLITLVREGTRCGATTFNNFRDFYLNLTVDGALLDIAYLTLSTENVNIDGFVDEWVDVILQSDVIFVNQIPICDQRFPTDVLADLQNNDDATVLETELDKRYPDRDIDIIFYSGIGTNQFHSFRYSDKINNFFWARDLDSQNKMLVVTNTTGRPTWNKVTTKSRLETCVEDVSVDKDDTRAAENVLTKVVTCDGLTYPVGVTIVYFESDDFPSKALTPKSDSPMVELTVEGVTLKYCFKTGFMCMFSKDESSGRYRILVYPNVNNNIGERDYVIGGGRGIHVAVWTLVVTFALTLYLYTYNVM